jgi:DNA-binding transcriptional regulator YiaG
VCHLCDNRLCVNPEHLFLGTQRDNVADMIAKGRQARGQRNGRSKLTAEDIERIRTPSGVTCHALAAQFGVSHQHISHIRRGNGWT